MIILCFIIFLHNNQIQNISRPSVQEFYGLFDDHDSQRRFLRPLQGIRSLLGQDGTLVPHLLGLLRAHQEILRRKLVVEIRNKKQKTL